LPDGTYTAEVVDDFNVDDLAARGAFSEQCSGATPIAAFIVTTRTVVVDSLPPVVTGAGATVAGRSAQLAASATDANSDLAFAWDFGDGFSGQGPTARHEYFTYGTFQATVTVTDRAGNSATASVPVVVAAPVPPTQPATPPTAQPFVAQAPDADIYLGFAEAARVARTALARRYGTTWRTGRSRKVTCVYWTDAERTCQATWSRKNVRYVASVSVHEWTTRYGTSVRMLSRTIARAQRSL
jgi:hypothetical protein